MSERIKTDTSGKEWQYSHEEICEVTVELSEAQRVKLYDEATAKRAEALLALEEKQKAFQKARKAYNEQKGATATADREAFELEEQARACLRKKKAKVEVYQHYPDLGQPMKAWIRTDPGYEGVEQRPREPLTADEMKRQVPMKLPESTDEYLDVVTVALRKMLTTSDPDGATRDHTLAEWQERLQEEHGLAISAEELEQLFRERCADTAVIEEADNLLFFPAPRAVSGEEEGNDDALAEPGNWATVAQTMLTSSNEVRATAQSVWAYHHGRKLDLKGDAKKAALQPIIDALATSEKFIKDGRSWRLAE